MKRVALAITLLALFPATLDAAVPSAGGAQLTINEIVAPVPVTGNPPGRFFWSPDASHYVFSRAGKRDNAPPVLYVHDMASGRDRRIVSAESSARGSRSREIAQIAWAPGSDRVAFLSGDALEIARADGSQPKIVAHGVDDPQWSPDGTRIAFVRDGDLYALTLATRHEIRLTHTGSATVLNGDPDWLYSEEMDVSHAFAWSPDGASLAYLTFDDSHVTDFPIEQYLKLPDNAVEHERYPLAGEANPKVALHVVPSTGGAVRTLYDGAPHDEYLVSFAWTPDSTHVVDEILDRAQQHLRLESFAREGSGHRTILRESDARFVDVSPAPRFIDRGAAFLWISERAEVSALYRVSTATGVATRLSGSEPIGAIEAVDERRGVAYVDALYPTRREHALLAFPIAAKGPPIDITPGAGSHGIAMAPSGTRFIDTYSSSTQPPVITRHNVRSASSAVIFRTPSLKRYALAKTQNISIDSAYGTLDATVYYPPAFDPSKTYPVIVNTYGGPLSVNDGGTGDDRWRGLMPHLLAERGFISLYLDGPASRFDRSENARMFRYRMGEIAIEGPIAAARWLARQPYVDPKRLGLFGWSYGGYLTAFTLTHAPKYYRSGISGAPPVDWRFYDTAYTERYMGVPQHEAAAYRRTAVLPAARNLRAQLLILQGSSDDNVHLANSIALLDAFVRAGKQVDYFVFPGSRHGPRGTANVRYLDAKMLAWWERTLQ